MTGFGMVKGYNAGLLKAALSALACLALFSCAPSEKKPPVEVPPPQPAVVKLPFEVQEERSMRVFEEILELTADVDRLTVLPELKAGFYKIINEYPDSRLAPESYMRLIVMALRDYIPPRVEEAEMLYHEFLKKHPAAGQRIGIDDVMIRFFYKNQLWEKLLEYTTPVIRAYLSTGNLRGPFYMFLYSEAKLHIGDTVEAEKGYKIVVEKFPRTAESLVAKDRLEEIKLKKR